MLCYNVNGNYLLILENVSMAFVGSIFISRLLVNRVFVAVDLNQVAENVRLALALLIGKVIKILKIRWKNDGYIFRVFLSQKKMLPQGLIFIYVSDIPSNVHIWFLVFTYLVFILYYCWKNDSATV